MNTSIGSTMLIAKELQREIGLQISPEVTSLISNCGSFLIQCAQFTYIYIGGFQDCPLMLRHFVDDRLVLLEVCRQIGQVKKKCRNIGSIPFPIGIKHYNCLSSFDAQNIERSMVNINLHSFHSRFPFDGNKYVKNSFSLGTRYLHFPTMEDCWENCENAYKVRRRDQMIFRVEQIID